MQNVIYTFTASFIVAMFIAITVIGLVCLMVYLEVDWKFKKTPLDARKDIDKMFNRVCSRHGYAFDAGLAESYKITEGVVKKELEDYLDELQELLQSYFPTRD